MTELALKQKTTNALSFLFGFGIIFLYKEESR